MYSLNSYFLYGHVIHVDNHTGSVFIMLILLQLCYLLSSLLCDLFGFPNNHRLTLLIAGKSCGKESPDKKDDSELWSNVEAQAAFLGPNLWEKTLSYDSDLKVSLFLFKI